MHLSIGGMCSVSPTLPSCPICRQCSQRPVGTELWCTHAAWEFSEIQSKYKVSGLHQGLSSKACGRGGMLTAPQTTLSV